MARIALVLGLVSIVGQAQAQVFGPATYEAPSYEPGVADVLARPVGQQFDNELARAADAPTRADRGLIVGGTALLVSSYALHVVGSSLWSSFRLVFGQPDTGAYFFLAFIPVIGPFAQLPYSTEPWEQALLVGMGALQTAGLAMIIAGNASRSPLVQRFGEGPDAMQLAILPSASPGGAALHATLTF